MRESFLFSTDNRTSVKCKIISFVAVHFLFFKHDFFFFTFFHSIQNLLEPLFWELRLTNIHMFTLLYFIFLKKNRIYSNFKFSIVIYTNLHFEPFFLFLFTNLLFLNFLLSLHLLSLPIFFIQLIYLYLQHEFRFKLFYITSIFLANTHSKRKLHSSKQPELLLIIYIKYYMFCIQYIY